MRISLITFIITALPSHAETDLPNLCGTWTSDETTTLSGEEDKPSQQNNDKRKVIFQNGRILRAEKNWEAPKEGNPHYIGNTPTYEGKELMSGLIVGQQVFWAEQGDSGLEIWTLQSDGSIDLAYIESGMHSIVAHATLKREPDSIQSCLENSKL